MSKKILPILGLLVLCLPNIIVTQEDKQLSEEEKTQNTQDHRNILDKVLYAAHETLGVVGTVGFIPAAGYCGVGLAAMLLNDHPEGGRTTLLSCISAAACLYIDKPSGWPTESAAELNAKYLGRLAPRVRTSNKQDLVESKQQQLPRPQKK